MKKNINVNIFGTIYAFDEDAYQLLQNYLDNMKSYFSKQTGGEEIADDIEHRIAELLWERKEAGATTVEIDAVRQILEELGDPEQMGGQEANVPDSTDEKENEEGHSQDKSGENNTVESHTSGHHTSEGYYNREEKKSSGIYAEQRSSGTYHRLYRDENDKVLAGVLSGLTHYFGWSEPIILRLIFLIFLFLTVGYAIMFYVILWICMKPARTAEERLEMNGKAVNPDSIKQEVLREDANGKVPGDKSSTTGCTKGCVWGCGCFVALLAIPVILFMIVMLFAGLLGIGGGLLGVGGGLLGVGGSLLGTMSSSMPALMQHMHFNVPGFNYSYTVTQTTSDLSDNAWNALPDTVVLYDAVCIDGVGTVIYQQADTCGVWVEEHNGNELEREDCNIYVSDGVLHVSPVEGGTEWENVTFRLTAPTLRNIEISGAGGFCAIDTLTGPSVRCDISGVGYATILVHSDSLNVDLSGIGHVTVSGFTNHYESSADGIGWLDDSALTRL